MYVSVHHGVARVVRLVAAIGVCIGIGVGTASCSRGDAPPPAAGRASSSRQQAPRPVPPAPPREIPHELDEIFTKLVELQRGGQFVEALPTYRDFVAGLERAFGADSPDLAPYLYNFGLMLKLAGDRAECVRLATSWTERFPESLRLRLLEATTRAGVALATNTVDPRAIDSLTRLVKPENWPRLLGLRVELEDLHAQLGALLQGAGRSSEALEVSKRGRELERGADHVGLNAVAGTSLAMLGRAPEALPYFRRIARVGDSALNRFHLASALLDTQDVAAADAMFTKLIAERPGELAVGTDWRSSGALLNLRAASCANARGRHREALELLIVPSILEPSRPRVLQEVARAARGLGRSEIAEAIVARGRELAACENHRFNGELARRSGDLASEAYYTARAHLEIARTGFAIDELTRALKLRGDLHEPALELARVRLLLGRVDLAAGVLRAALERDREPLVAFECARVLVLAGRADAARTLLDDHTLSTESLLARVASEPDRSRRVVEALVRRARLELELGAIEAAAFILRHELVTVDRSDELLICSALLALQEGDTARAKTILAQSFEFLPGGRSVSSALGLACRVIEGDPPEPETLGAFDVSDLVDYPAVLRLCETAPTAKSEGAVADRWRALRGLTDRARALRERRTELLLPAVGVSDRDIVSRWRELLDAYVEGGARRKAREVAWYLHSFRARGVEENRALARVLDRPGEILQRLAAARRGLEARASDAELADIARETRAALGLDRDPR